MIVPTLESRQALHLQLYALFCSQTWPDKELIVIETYLYRPSAFFCGDAGKDPRVVFLTFRKGPHEDITTGAKRNLGQFVASGDFVVNFDDDDIYAPEYVETMISEMELGGGDLITLCRWYNFDVKTGQTGLCDPLERAVREQVSCQDPKIQSWLWGYGFSYAYRLDRAIEGRILYPNQTLNEDYDFFEALKRFCGETRAVLLDDREGLVLHMMHQDITSPTGSSLRVWVKGNTAPSFCYNEVSREELLDFRVAEHREIFDFYLTKFPRLDKASDFILYRHSGENGKNGHGGQLEFRIHCSRAGFMLRCCRRETAAEVKRLCRCQLSLAFKDPVELYRAPPPCLGDGREFRMATSLLPIQLLPGLRRPLRDEERVGHRTEELWLLLPEEVRRRDAAKT